MTSQIRASSFHNCLPSFQTLHFAGPFPNWPDSFSPSGPVWGSASCTKETKNHLSVVDDGTAMETIEPKSYLGVRVKNPVRELMMKKYRDKRAWSLNKPIQDDAPRPESCFTDIQDTMPQTPESGPLSITTAQMREMSPQAVPHCNTAHPHPDTPTETSVHAVYPITSPGSLPVAVGNSFQISPFTPQLDPPPPPQPLSSGAHSGTSFFQWQITQEEKKVAGVAPEQLVAQDSDGDTFLHIAVAQGRRALSYVLARKMAQLGMVDVKDHIGQSALQVSVVANQHLIVQDLITLGAQVNTVDCWGRSPLHVCAERAHVLTLQAIHKALGATGQRVNMEAVNYDGLTALHTAVLSHNAVLRDLECEAVQQSPQTPALLQRKKQLEECVSTLMKMGASYRTKDHKCGRTSLHMAAEEANVEVMQVFLDQPDSLATINTPAYTGNTALHVVSALSGRAAQVDAVKLLMRRGADPTVWNLEKERPSQLVPEGPMGNRVWRILKGKEKAI